MTEENVLEIIFSIRQHIMSGCTLPSKMGDARLHDLLDVS